MILKVLAIKIIYLNSPILSEKFTAPSIAARDVTFDCVILVAWGLFGAISTGMVHSNLVSMGPTISIIVGPVGFSDVGCWSASSCGWPCMALHSQ
jgi:CBS-domain-containing membrane protein